MFGFKPDALLSLLRHVLTFLAGVIVAKGWITADAAAQLVGAVITIVGILFAMFFHASSNGAVATQSTTSNITKTTETTTTSAAPAIPAPSVPAPITP